jgi:hypothetical protein
MSFSFYARWDALNSNSSIFEMSNGMNIDAIYIKNNLNAA